MLVAHCAACHVRVVRFVGGVEESGAPLCLKAIAGGFDGLVRVVWLPGLQSFRLEVAGRVVESVSKAEVGEVAVKELSRALDWLVGCCEGRPAGCYVGAIPVGAACGEAAEFELSCTHATCHES